MQLFSYHFVHWTNFFTGFSNPAQEYRLPIKQLRRLYTSNIMSDECHNSWRELMTRTGCYLYFCHVTSTLGENTISYLGAWRHLSWHTIFRFAKCCAWWAFYYLTNVKVHASETEYFLHNLSRYWYYVVISLSSEVVDWQNCWSRAGVLSLICKGKVQMMYSWEYHTSYKRRYCSFVISKIFFLFRQYDAVRSACLSQHHSFSFVYINLNVQ